MVNIESQRMQTDSIRLAGNMNFSLSYQENNNVSLFVTKNAAAIQYKTKSLKDIFLFLGNLDISKSESTEFSNSAFAHFRYTRKINKWLRWEAFAQVQYNRLLSVGIRSLTGTGPRFKLFGAENAVGYLGTLYMFEYEETTEINPEVHQDHRLSSYLTMTVGVPRIKGEMVTTTYFQPRFDLLNDFRVSHQTSLAFNITRHFKWITGFSYMYDENPPQGVNRETLSLDQGFRIEF